MFHASVTTNVNHWRRRLTIMVIRIMSNSLSSPLPSDALLFSLRRRRLVLPLGTTSTQPFLVSSFHPSLFSPPHFPFYPPALSYSLCRCKPSWTPDAYPSISISRALAPFPLNQ